MSLLRLAVPRVRPSLVLARTYASSSSTTTTSTPVPTSSSSTPAQVLQQSPNVPTPWSKNQNPRSLAYDNARFEQVNLELQPQPLSAMGMVAEDPIRLIKGRKAVCDGGAGPLGHPKIYINLDKPGPKACGYCGIRYEQAHDEHH